MRTNAIYKWFRDFKLLKNWLKKLVKLRIKFLELVVKPKKTDYNAKIKYIEGKYFTTADYNNFSSDILGVKIKEKELVNKFDIDKKISKY